MRKIKLSLLIDFELNYVEKTYELTTGTRQTNRDIHLRPVQIRSGPTEVHHPESHLHVLRLGQLFNLGFIQTRVEYHRGIAHCLLIFSAEKLPVHT